MSVRRFFIGALGIGTIREDESPTGPYVRFTDHERAVAEARRRAFQEALQAFDFHPRDPFDYRGWLLMHAKERAAEGDSP